MENTEMYTNKKIIASLLGVAFLMAVQTGFAQTSSDTARAIQALENLRGLYEGLESAQFSATTKTYLGENVSIERAEIVGSGSYDYHADFDKYRVDCSTESRLNLAEDALVAFDGRQFQYLSRSMSLLSLQTERPQSLPTALPNPLFLPVDFSTTDQDDCPGCQLDLVNVADPRRWQQLIDGLEVKSSINDRQLEIILSGGSVDGTAFDFHVLFEQSPSSGLLPKQIDRVTREGGKTMGRIVMRAYEEIRLPSGKVFPAPSHISISAVDYRGSGLQEMFTDVFIKGIALNQDLSRQAEVFTIDPALANTIWDSDAGVFLKHANQKINGSLGTLKTETTDDQSLKQ
jgi:hypothetical protein